MGLFNFFNFTLIAVILAFILEVSSYPQKYSNKYDHIDIDSILKNERLLQTHINCILDKGPCTQEGKDFRDYLPEAITTSCEKCTAAQKRIARKAARYLMDKRKPEWEQILQKYDPNKERIEDFKKFMAET